MGVYARGKRLYVRFRQPDGWWRSEPTKHNVGDEARALAALDIIERDMAAQSAATVILNGDAGVTTQRRYAADWLEERKTETVEDDTGRINKHIVPALGSIKLAELRPRHVQDFVRALSAKKKLGNRRKDGSRAGRCPQVG